MTRVNWTRLLAGGVVATLICFATDGMMHEGLLHAEWAHVYVALSAQPPQQASGHAAALISFFDYELGRGLGAVFIYVMMRARYGAGPKTALWAGLVIWLVCSVSGPAQFIPLGFYSHALWWKVASVQLVTTLAASLAGAAIYREGVSQ
jgi:hypothetical protein